MSTQPAKFLLKNDPRFAETPDYAELRRLGLEHIAALSGDLWTDHNAHDPGVTLLELLCYALTDLSYRRNLNPAELFAPATPGGEDGNFFTPAEILTNNPVTLLDYRKMLIDIPGVRNAWLEPAAEQEVALCYERPNSPNCDPRNLKTKPAEEEGNAELRLSGLYEVLLDIDPLLTAEETTCRAGATTIGETLAEVERRLGAHRNLCEDFIDIRVLKDEEIGLCLDLDLTPKADPAIVLGLVFAAIEDFISPRIRFSSLQELLAEGKAMEEIFRGRPYLPAYNAKYGLNVRSHGFVDVEQLAELTRPEVIRASDLYRVIMSVEGVRAIRELKLAGFIDGLAQGDEQEWELPLTPGHRPMFAPERGGYTFHKGQLLVPLDTNAIITRFRRRLADYRKTAYAHAALDAAPPYGRHRPDVGNHYSVQHELPTVYGLGEGELSASAPAARLAQARQLGGFLTFFDQLLANFCQQLANTRNVYSWLPEVDKTNFVNAQLGIPYETELLRFKAMVNAVESVPQAIVRSITFFTHPLNRDQAVASMVNTFLDLPLEELRSRLNAEEEDGGRFIFYFHDARSQPVLRGIHDYGTAEAALAAGEAAALKLLFQGGVAENYRNDNYPGDHRYGFTILDRRVDHASFLEQIAESPAEFAVRRNELLDHLLARFNESFTDYVLLTYALEQTTPDPLQLIEAKERFLREYPRISRERGKGLDYRFPNLPGNRSGLEQRVGHLIGLEETDAPLNAFSVQLRRQEIRLVWRDHRGRVLLRSVRSFTTGEDWAPFAEELLLLLATPSAYLREDCPGESIFGFAIVDATGLVVAEPAMRFPTAERREEHLECTQIYFGNALGMTSTEVGAEGAEGAEIGVRVMLEAEEQGFYVYFPSLDNKLVYLETLAVYEDELTARQAGLRLLVLSRNPDAYRPWNVAGRYGFELVDTDGTVVGRHPRDYGTKRTRDKHLRTVREFFTTRLLDHRLTQLPDSFFWQLDACGHELRGLIPFGTEDAARASWALNEAYFTSVRDYAVTERVAGKWWVEVRRNDGLLLAESEPFGAREAAQNALAELADHWRSAYLARPGVVCRSGDWYFELWLAGEVILRGTRTYADRAAAAWACLLFGKVAALEENYRWMSDPDGCLRGFRVRDAEGTVAATITYFSDEVAEEKKSVTLAYASANYLPCGEGFREFRWRYRVLWENCRGRCEDLLLSAGDGWDTAGDANEAAGALLAHLAGESPFVDGVEGEKYTFAAGAAGNVLATHPGAYATPAERDRVKADALAYFRAYRELQEPEGERWTTEDVHYVHCKSLASCAETTAETFAGNDCVLSAYQLHKDEALATLPAPLSASEERNTFAAGIREAAVRKELGYTAFSLARTQVQGKGQGARFYYNWSVPGLPAFRSVRSFPDGYAAETAFWSDLPDLLRAGARAKAYRAFDLAEELQSLQQNCWPSEVVTFEEYCLEDLGTDEQLVLMGRDGLPVVYLPRVPSTRFPAVRTAWRLYCQRYPFHPEAGGWRFHLYAPDRPVVWLRGAKLYPDHATVRLAYLELLDLLPEAAHYRTDDQPEAGRYGLRIVEALLDARITYADELRDVLAAGDCPVICPAEYSAKEYVVEETSLPVREECPAQTNADPFCPRAWQEGLDTFLLYGTDEAYCYEFLDAGAGCQHGFRFVRDGYRIARSPRENHTPAEREALLDWLYHDANCRAEKGGTPYETCLSFGADAYRVLLRPTDGGDFHWRLVNPSPVLTEAEDCDPATAEEHLEARQRAEQDWQDRRTELLNLAQEPDFYQPRLVGADDEGVSQYRLLLLDEAGVVVMESPRVFSREEIVAAARERIDRARIYPIYRFRGKYGFQVFSPVAVPDFRLEEPRDCPPTFSAPAAAPSTPVEETTLYGGSLELHLRLPGEVIWESAEEFATETAARCAYDCFCALLTDVRNYQRLQLADCNLFGLELTRPDRILAEHPRRYAGATDLEAAKKRTFACINREGMRLVEHILLRPRTEEDATIPNICPAPATAEETKDPFCPNRLRWADAEKQVAPVTGVNTLSAEASLELPDLPYVPGADPYSHWATVVLPYWPNRFQNANFRAFFEDSLRREAPAHVALKICWLDPKQIREFERHYHKWMSTLDRRDNCARSGAQDRLIAFLSEMTSVYAPSRLQGGCENAGITESGAVLLGQTQLS